MRIQNGDQGYLATLPLVRPDSSIRDALVKIEQFQQKAAVVVRADGAYIVVTAEELMSALGTHKRKNAGKASVGELFADRDSAQYADFAVMGRMMHGLWEVRGGQKDYRIVAIGYNAATVLGPTEDHWQQDSGR